MADATEWSCSSCNFTNTSKRDKCKRCDRARVSNADPSDQKSKQLNTEIEEKKEQKTENIYKQNKINVKMPNTISYTAKIINYNLDDQKDTYPQSNARKLQITGSDEKEQSNPKQKRAIIFVVDVSTSMRGDRINGVRDGIIPFIENICIDNNILIKLITFNSKAGSFDIPKNQTAAKNVTEDALNLAGGTDFKKASETLVKICTQILITNPNETMTIIICSDGEPRSAYGGAQNAHNAHIIWKTFVNQLYIPQHKQFPFVEVIGIGNKHNSEILDGFICHDDSGNYVRAISRENIVSAFEQASMNAEIRTTFQLKINSPCVQIFKNLWLFEKINELEVVMESANFEYECWIDLSEYNEFMNEKDKVCIKLNGNDIVIEECLITHTGKIQENMLNYYHQLLKDMNNHLRSIQDEKILKEEGSKINQRLDEMKDEINSIIKDPKQVIEVKNNINMLLENCGTENDNVEERIKTMKLYKDLQKQWKTYNKVKTDFISTLKTLREILQDILTGSKRMKEIKQHILHLHFSKKHAKRMNKLILTSEQLIMRQEMYDNIQIDLKLKEENIINLSNELGSGCFLSTMTLKDCALDGQSLWLCGRVNRSGGVQVSNPEIIRIEYISPNLVSYEYFNMAMDISSHNSESEKGFLDGSRNIINARLFPIYGGNMEYLKICKPYIFEVLSHTLSGRNDIKINDYSTLSAILGYMIATHKQTTQNLIRIFKDILPSYIMLSKYINVYPYKNEKNKEIFQ
eukprot:235689_1